MSCSIAKRGRGRPRKASIKTDICPYTTSRKFRIKIKTLGQQEEYWDHVLSQTIPRKPRTKNTRILNRKKLSWGQRYLLDHNPNSNPISQKEVDGLSFLDLDLDESPINIISPLSPSSVDKLKPISSQNEVEGVFTRSFSELKISLSTPLSEYIIPGPIPDNIDELAWDEDMNRNFWKDIPDFEE